MKLFVIVRRFHWKASYTQSISSIARKTCVDNIMSSCYSSLVTKENLFTRWSLLTCLAFCLDWTCDWMSQLVVFNPNPLCLDSTSFPYWPELIRSSLTTQYNQFMSVDLIELSIIPYSLFLLIIYTPMLFPSFPLGIWWKTLPTILRRILLVRPIPHTKY